MSRDKPTGPVEQEAESVNATKNLGVPRSGFPSHLTARDDYIWELRRELAFYVGQHHGTTTHRDDALRCQEGDCVRLRELLNRPIPTTQDTSGLQTQTVPDKSSCPHLHQDFQGRVVDTIYMKCLDCGASLPESGSESSSSPERLCDHSMGRLVTGECEVCEEFPSTTPAATGDAPERIWICRKDDWWQVVGLHVDSDVEYVRAYRTPLLQPDQESGEK